MSESAASPSRPVRDWLTDRVFLTLSTLDEALHNIGWTWAWLCLRVGRMEPAFYDRHTDWDHPIYVKPPSVESLLDEDDFAILREEADLDAD